ncbi:MAG: SAM-dependent DNA methyltransferase [Anaerolineae bacterium]|nr:SAM-dependent DNA methyltransferase [Anaerolineae bacterium]
MRKSELSAAIKTARDIMRKDAGLSTDVDRIPQLAWILFLKCFDDLEQRRLLLGGKHRDVVEAPYRWRDWAADEDRGRTGDDLLDFVNDELFPHLRGLTGAGSGDQRDVIAAIFSETYNRMLSGYLLRDVVNLVDRFNFNSSDDIHTLSHLYESMLREMRDAAGTNGEFYTPRPVVRFMVEQVAPQIGETVYDPAAGTGGFLVEAYEYLHQQQRTVEERETLQTRTLYGTEKKPMPYLLGMMNLLLHGIEYPNLARANTLSTPLHEIGDRQRYDVIVTNPPFGGEEEAGVQANFSEGTRTSETALLFLQFIMRSLSRPKGDRPGGRCAMVLPNGPLFATGVAARIKQELLAQFNLHTVVRLPNGVFAPYTSIPTNLLFFQRNGPTEEIWYYELPLPEGRKNYTKTKPLRDQDFDECRDLWNERPVTEHSWRVSVAEVADNDYNLDLKNPAGQEGLVHRPPEELAASILEKERRIAEIVVQIRRTLAEVEQ